MYLVIVNALLVDLTIVLPCFSILGHEKRAYMECLYRLVICSQLIN